MMVRAVNRAKGFNHPLFKVNVRCGAISRFVSMRVCRSVSIRVKGSGIKNNPDGNHEKVAAATNIDRAMLLGGSGAGKCLRSEGGRSLQHG